MAVQWIKQGHGLHLPQPRPPSLANQSGRLTPRCASPHTHLKQCVCVRIVPQWGLPRSDYRPVALFTSHPSQKLSRGEK